MARPTLAAQSRQLDERTFLLGVRFALAEVGSYGAERLFVLRKARQWWRKPAPQVKRKRGVK